MTASILYGRCGAYTQATFKPKAKLLDNMQITTLHVYQAILHLLQLHEYIQFQRH